MLAGMALKWRWRERMRAAGKPTDEPNLVTGANVQVCWEKFCRYWDVEPRLVPMEGDRFHLDAEQAVEHCDENTIGVVGDPRVDVRRQLRAGRRRSRPRWRLEARARDRRSDPRRRAHPAASSRRSSSPTSNGTSGSRACSRSTRQATSTGSSTRRRLGDLARQGGAAGGPDLRRQLPRRQHADVRAQLLAAGERGRSRSTSCSSAWDATGYRG